jgi:hypothetical protein
MGFVKRTAILVSPMAAGADMSRSTVDSEKYKEELIRRLTLLAGSDELARVWYRT